MSTSNLAHNSRVSAHVIILVSEAIYTLIFEFATAFSPLDMCLLVSWPLMDLSISYIMYALEVMPSGAI